MERAGRSSLLADASGAVADLGVFIPIAAALVLRNGLDAGSLLVCAGLFYLVAGAYFRVPVPVQPLKAAAAIAIATGLPAAMLAAAAVLLGCILVALGATGATVGIARLFTKPIVRGLQLGVGLMLLRSALDLLDGGELTPWFAALAILVVLLAGSRLRYPIALVVVLGGVAFSLFTRADPVSLRFSLWEPSVVAPFDASMLWSALWLLVVPQIPLTFGNAVVGLVDLEHRYFPERSVRVTPRSVSFSGGIANLCSGLVGGMPMCHGSGGLTAHYRAGARTTRSNVIIGAALLSLGLALGPSAFRLLSLIPLTVLVGLLAFAGVSHALLATDLSGSHLAVALAMGLTAAWTSNLALGLAVGFSGVALGKLGASLRAPLRRTTATFVAPTVPPQPTHAEPSE